MFVTPAISQASWQVVRVKKPQTSSGEGFSKWELMRVFSAMVLYQHLCLDDDNSLAQVCVAVLFIVSCTGMDDEDDSDLNDWRHALEPCGYWTLAAIKSVCGTAGHRHDAGGTCRIKSVCGTAGHRHDTGGTCRIKSVCGTAGHRHDTGGTCRTVGIRASNIQLPAGALQSDLYMNRRS